jgi:hypothetical protein
MPPKKTLLLEHAREIMLANTWGSYFKYPRYDWQAEVVNDDTQLGYWDWVMHKIEKEN